MDFLITRQVLLTSWGYDSLIATPEDVDEKLQSGRLTGRAIAFYMSFFRRQGWQVQFLEADLKTPPPRKLTFTDQEKIRELARRGEAWGDSESREMLEGAIEQGRGGCYLRLTSDQYARLRKP